jgi:hypothetical protein
VEKSTSAEDIRREEAATRAKEYKKQKELGNESDKQIEQEQNQENKNEQKDSMPNNKYIGSGESVSTNNYGYT